MSTERCHTVEIANNDADACPRCHNAPDPATGQCRCPAPASQSGPTLSFSSGALVAQAESLFETYLAARLVRARRQLSVAKVALLRDPRSRTKLDEMRRAEKETQRLQQQLLEQARKAAQTREQTRDTAPPVPPRAESPADTQAQPTEGFRAVQAAKAEEAYASAASDVGRRSRPDDRDCPRCGNRVPGETAACGCGYEFVPAGRNVGAEPFLSEEELAALRNTVKSR